MAREVKAELKKIKEPISATVWCVLLLVIMAILFCVAFFVLEHERLLFQFILACTTGVSASAVVTFFAERSNRIHRKHLCSVYLKELHTVVHECVEQNDFQVSKGWDYLSEKEPAIVKCWLEATKFRYGINAEDNPDDKSQCLYYISPVIAIVENIDSIRTAFTACLNNYREYLTTNELQTVIEVQNHFDRICDKIAETIEAVQYARKEFLDDRSKALATFVRSNRQKEIINIGASLQPLLMYNTHLIDIHARGSIIDELVNTMLELHHLEELFVNEGYIEYKQYSWTEKMGSIGV